MREKKKTIVSTSYDRLRKLLESSTTGPRLPFDDYDKFQFASPDTRGKKSVLHRYDPTRFRVAGPWLIERCTNDIIVLSLETFALRKFAIAPMGATATKIHVTVVQSTWDSRSEFHVTTEKVSKNANGFSIDVVCSEFYNLTDASLTKADGKTSRISCSKKSRMLDSVSDYHAAVFVGTFFYT